ncbi:MAG: S46 family peptidase [Pyrinomonadaceae bacterium]|nr:S46 family peptidase [Pyrinomonadaceae bacterium]
MIKIDKRSLVSLLLVFSVILTSVSLTLAKFDEGMYTPDKIVTLPLQQKGLKIKPSDIYNPKTGGISEAIIRLEIGCTAEFISPNGLILTNHHCGLDALVAASTPEKRYGDEGYKANSMKEELPAKDYSLNIPIRVEDVTQKIITGTEKLTGEARDNAIKANIEKLERSEQSKAPEGNTVRVQAVSNGYFYYLYENKLIKDIRVVYAPPQTIGFFGGDPDNFEWTRHTGDFTYLRAYVAPDGKSAEYSPNNVPFKPRKFLTISLNGLKENDFVFVMGNPGGTTRYRESQSVNYSQQVNFPFLYEYLRVWGDTLREIGREDEEKRIALQGEVANLDNSRKLYEGGILAMRRADIVSQKKSDEAKFATWVNENPSRKAKYGNLLADIARASDEFYKTAARDRLVRTIPNLGNTGTFKEVIDAFAAVAQGKTLNDKKKAEIQQVMQGREPMLESAILKFFFSKLSELGADQKYLAAENLFGGATGKARKDAEEKFVNSFLENKDFSTADKIIGLYSKSANSLKEKYPKLFEFAAATAQEQAAIAGRTNKFNAEINNLRLLYMEGISEMKGIKPYPDANFTQRFTYGTVKGYEPREAVIYTPFTTLKGVIDKDTGVFPFIVPQKLKELQAAKDFGRFGVGDSVPVNFLATTDIIGGNSGSPIMNAYGEQVGIVFDGNYEGLGNDIFFSPKYGRTISVDIRYVLFLTEKFAGAGWILNEMKFASAKSKK